ncbi:Nitrogenase-stabilizing/protective protein NifW [Vibrio aerogenes CECT 7868]|uniref:Nitrogenase-stabilizing/protective protein NifW n=1 Tax=Vibrio aerogenes CECT 7868 TaxID=1216006 RepID=A0A1M5WYC9_9VIBR|nr:nitrogenase-stabilizing/protective protein NifW [Vibrio aerogenes]SHH92557.1 Nitrogenase-stabilizing/protective protein NifW [Vibrio aerogenes CECT 7868]
MTINMQDSDHSSGDFNGDSRVNLSVSQGGFNRDSRVNSSVNQDDFNGDSRHNSSVNGDSRHNSHNSSVVDADRLAAMDGLETAEDFLDFFEIAYDTRLVQIKHIQLLRMYQKLLPAGEAKPGYDQHRRALCMAYSQLTQGRELAFEASGCQSCSSDCTAS